MKLVKCPRCDLNYITESEKYCKICLREMKGEPSKEEVELCSVCNEAPALPGKDVCLFCLNEMNGERNSDDQDSGVAVDPNSISELESVSTMDEIMPEVDDTMPDKEFDEIADELSLESVREDEDNQDDEDTDEDI